MRLPPDPFGLHLSADQLTSGVLIQTDEPTPNLYPLPTMKYSVLLKVGSPVQRLPHCPPHPGNLKKCKLPDYLGGTCQQVSGTYTWPPLGRPRDQWASRQGTTPGLRNVLSTRQVTVLAGRGPHGQRDLGILRWPSGQPCRSLQTWAGPGSWSARGDPVQIPEVMLPWKWVRKESSKDGVPAKGAGGLCVTVNRVRLCAGL